MKSLADKDLFRPDEVCRYFGICRRTLHNWVETGKIEGIKVSRKVTRFSRESLLKLGNEGRE